MSGEAPMTMGSATLMGSGAATIEIAIAPSEGYYRYDIVTVGEDQTLDYLSGEESATGPVAPSVQTDHLQVGKTIFVQGGRTAIYSADIGAEFTTQVPVYVVMSLSGTYISGEDYFTSSSGEVEYPNPECTIKVQIKDQYGQLLSPGAPGYDMTLEKISGTGQVWSSDDSWQNITVDQESISDNYYDFKYKRVEDQAEQSVFLQCTLNVGSLTNQDQIMLVNTSGEVIAF
jgi:hypothetical protein